MFTLFLMTEKGLKVLQALIEYQYKGLIQEVVVGRDKNVENDFGDEIIHTCEQAEITYIERKDFNQSQAPFSLAISWRWLISPGSSKLIVIHDSLLPKYRGFSPLVNMLLNEESEIGATMIYAAEGYDTGDVISQQSSKITYPIKIQRAIEIVIQAYIKLVLDLFETVKLGKKPIGKPQNEQEATYSLWRDESDYLIDWNQSSKFILNLINAVSGPYKGAAAFVNLKGIKKVRILEGTLLEDVRIENRDPGKVMFIKECLPVVVCGSGLLQLVKVIDDETKEDILPLKKFRVRFSSRPLE